MTLPDLLFALGVLLGLFGLAGGIAYIVLSFEWAGEES